MNTKYSSTSKWLLTALFLILTIGAANAQTNNQVCPVGGYATVACPVITDEVMRANIASRLLGAVTTGESSVCVQVVDGVVTLVGQVADQRQKELATFLAASVRGVVRVNNLLVLGGATATDVELVGIVKNQIDRQAFDTSRVQVYANSGVIELRGMVDSELARSVIGDITSAIYGVVAVHNNLIVSDVAGNNLD